MAVRFRTIDGSDNNRALPGLNQADTNFARIGPGNFADGISEMTPVPIPARSATSWWRAAPTPIFRSTEWHYPG